MNIVQLPQDVLAEIFAYICDRKILRRISKNFKNVIDSYPKLMQKYVLNVGKMEGEDKAQPLYQNLKFEKLNFDEFKTFNLFTKQQQNKVKEIYIKRKGDIVEAVWFLQSIIATFNNLQTLFLDISSKTGICGLMYGIKIKLLPNELSKLESLTIRSSINITDVMFMFADIKTIKKLTLNVKFASPEFPKDAAWKLEELNMYILTMYDETFEFTSGCKKFLESQKTTLKILRHNFSEEMCNFIMLSIPDLELLHLRIISDNDFCDELKPNEKLKSLSLTSFPDEDESFTDEIMRRENSDKSLEKILRHYKNIQYLNIRPNGELDHEEIMYNGSLEPKNVELLNLTHLSFHDLVGNFLDSVKMPNLKCLEINIDLDDYGDNHRYFDDLALNAENFANVEKLSINGLSMENITAIIEKCQKLKHLNLIGIRNYYPSDDLDSDDDGYEEHRTVLMTLFSKAPQLKIVGTLENTQCREIVEGAFAELNRKVTFKNYNNFEDMMNDYWPLDMIGDFEFCSSKFIKYKCLKDY